MMTTNFESLNTHEIIADLDIYARHHHTSKKPKFHIQKNAPDELAEAARRLVERGLLSGMEDAQLTREGLEIARHVYQSLTCQAGK